MKALRTGTSVAPFILFLSLAAPLFGDLELEPQKYNARWAVVVGINYESVAVNSVSALEYAEADANDFHARLMKNYGFQASGATLLLGADATKKAIEGQIGKICDEASENDCVIFYFSGHGVNREGEGELLPSDVEFSGASANPNSVVEMNWIFNHLSKRCKARHKLLILDCCHSGAIFSAGGRVAAVVDASRVDEEVYNSPGFQAMTASRDQQKARDGNGKIGNSPFTDALLKALESIPSMPKKGQGFTTTELFSGMQMYLEKNLHADQTPRCSWLDGNQGEFHFYPEGEFPDPNVPDEQKRKVMLAMVPGSFGLWWFEETPWFMPGLRYEILAKNEGERSLSLEMIDPLRLEEAAREASNELMDDSRAEIRMRRRHLDMLLKAKGDEWDNAVNIVMEDLQKAVATDEDKEDAVDPKDLHYLAVLEHASRLPSAKEHYEKALDLYKKEAEYSPSAKPLLALCLADRGVYAALIDRDYEGACKYYAEARSAYGSFTPAPFQIYVLSREAEALAKLGRRGMARQRLKDAHDVAKEVDPERLYPLTASLYEAEAWLKMDWREFQEAIDDFESSKKILANRQDHDAAIKRMHHIHGIALAQRYLGKSPTAEATYRMLLKDEIFERIKLMNESVGQESNYRQTKGRLTERWVNTLERCGDCSLFGNPQDVAQAADDYRRSVRATRYLPPEKALMWERRMRQKWALALALKSKIQDLDLAEEQRNEIKKIIEELPESGRKLVPAMEILEKITGLMLAHCRALACVDADCEDRKKFEAELEQFREELNQLAEKNFLDPSLSRDDIEAAMFALKIILEEFPDPSMDVANKNKGRVERRKYIELLLEYCRLGRRGGVQALHFVRPYYDCAIAGLIKLEPKDTKQLVEVAWEAMLGQPHFKLRSDQATLVLYCMEDQSYFFLDVPRGMSAIYQVQPGIDFKAILAASQRDRGPEGGLDLPADLRKELFAAPGEVRLCWRDHVKQLGTGDPYQYMPGTGEPQEHETAKVTAEHHFPFELPEIVRVSDEQLAGATPVLKSEEQSVPLTSTKRAGTTQVSAPQ